MMGSRQRCPDLEGNSGDRVSAHTRVIAGAMFIVPKDLGDALEPTRFYWIDDPQAKFVVKARGRSRPPPTK